ncbi:MAG: cobalamin biosynthesis protein CobD, partial [Alphaproteobacteria bacterium]|nr:cobalamin biosynthesis protein CobD [Alphaproteobacteria bacterium]
MLVPLPDAAVPGGVFAVLLVALALDAVLGDPAWLYRRVPHPIVLIGRLIGALERRLNRAAQSERARRALGVATVAIVVGLAAAVGWALAAGLRLPGVTGWGWIVEAVLASTLIAWRGLVDHVAAVARGLETGGLDGGRDAVRHIVGRDPQTLDAAGVARAAIESAAENWSDGVGAPVFWFILLGLPGLLAYKAVNTLDSMIGHRNERYLAFGWAAARLDDGANWVPARLAGGLFCLA